ncbi:translesion DNA synthesis-associated protein ImuA, partial [uncultured Xylophilus sp.]|uniref:translesion DNA synthesis-associated protein ImuA n=1 Tax=uncultured Xylophilus sp. TaxID=296832 RepID=UPI003454F2C2
PLSPTAPGRSADDALAAIEGLWRGSDIEPLQSRIVPTSWAALDAELPGGGWPCNSLTECLTAQPAILEWRLVGPALAPLAAGGRPIALIGAPKIPHVGGLAHLGLQPRMLVHVAASAPAERLWATEQLVKAGAAAAVLAWLPQARPEQIRRLQVLAQAHDGPVILFRPIQAGLQSSAAPLRLEAAPANAWQLRIQIVKRRGPMHDTPLLLDSIPGGLAQVLTERVRSQPAQVGAVSVATPAVAIPSPQEVTHAPAYAVGGRAAVAGRPRIAAVA